MGRIAKFLLMSPIANWIADFGFWLHKRQIAELGVFRQIGCAESSERERVARQRQAFFRLGRSVKALGLDAANATCEDLTAARDHS